MFKRTYLILSLLLLASCAGMNRNDAGAGMPNEIAGNPAMLFNGEVPFDQMTFRGIKLGDPESAIAEPRIISRADGGWIVCNDGARYRIEEGVVTILGVWDPKVLEKLKIKIPADIATRFGKPQATDDAGRVIIHRYAGGRVSVLWNNVENQLNAVNVSK